MLGYACINETLAKNKIYVNRGMKLSTFKQKGPDYAAELIFNNINDLKKILLWNIENNIYFYRMSSDMFPWKEYYNLEDLKNWDDIKNLFFEISKIVKENKIRLTFHPGPFNKLASLDPKIVKNTIFELDFHSKIMDLLELSETPYNKINIHIGGVYGNKLETIKRFCLNFNLLSESTKKRLTVENDDIKGHFTVNDLKFVYEQIGTPIVFDYHHHLLNNDGTSLEDGLKIAVGTWPKDIVPVVHYSESKENGIVNKAHSDYISNHINTFNLNVDIMLEVKKKELALINYRSKYEYR